MLASTCVKAGADEALFSIRYVGDDGVVNYDGDGLYSCYSSGGEFYNLRGDYIRPIVILKSTVQKIGGAGTSEDPYTFTVKE